MTPEGKVKEAVKNLLAKYDIRMAKDAGTYDEAAGWYYMPMQSGLGVNGIPDFVGNNSGRFFSIETKAPGKSPTGFQALQIEAIRVGGGLCLVMDTVAGVVIFERWLLGV